MATRPTEPQLNSAGRVVHLPSRPHGRPLWRVCLLGALALAGLGAQAAELKLRILETSDVHMNLLNYDYYQDKPTDEYGLSKAATLIKAARAEAPNSLLFDNGDLLQGNPLGDYIARVKPLPAGQVHPAYKVLNALGVDAANIGNHEFNYGLPFLRQAIAGANFPYVSANVHVDNGKPLAEQPHAFTPYVILERRFVDTEGQSHTLKVGVIGFVPPQIMMWDRQHLLGKLTTRDIVETARRLVPEIKSKGADIVVAIPHSGFERSSTTAPMSENTVARLVEVPDVDAVLFGHSHGEFPGPFFANHPKVDLARGTINGVPATMPGRWGDHLGVIDIVLDNSSGRWLRKESRAELRPIWDRASRRATVASDPAIERLITEEHQGTLGYIRAKVSQTSSPIQSYFAQVADDPSVQLVSQAQLAYLRTAVQGTEYEPLPLLSAAAPFKTGGRQGWTQYTDIPAGPLTVRNIADLYVYPNTFQAVLLTGAQVRDWLEMAAGQFNRINPAGPAEQDLLNPNFRSYNFDTIDGLTYRIDLSQPARFDATGKLVAPSARRIVDLQHQGKPIDEAARFVVATNNYRASGGGNFPMLDGKSVVVDAPDETRNLVLQYLATSERIDPRADDNWRFAPLPGIKLRFVSGAGGVAHLARYPDITLVKHNGDGSALFELITR